MTKKTLFTGNPYSAEKVIAAVTGSSSPATATNLAWGPASVNAAVDAVLAHGNHAQFLIRKLWAEFIASAIPQGTLDALVANYRASGFQLKPLIRSILTNPLIFESIDEPNLIKPPMVYIVGALRQLDAPLKYNQVEAAMNAMQQKVYFPPNVAGWEGGMAWLNTNTVQGRFDLINRLQYLQVLQLLPGRHRRRGQLPGRAAAGAPDHPERAGLVRPGAHVAQHAVGVGWDEGRGARLRRHRAREHRVAAAATALLIAGADSRRPRRTGDVTCAASNAKRSSWRGSVTNASPRRCRSLTRRSTASRRAAARRT